MTVTNNLDLEQVAENQASPEVTVNDATLRLGMALTESFDVDLTGANQTILRGQFQATMKFYLHGVSTTRSVTLGTTVPKKSLSVFECAAANTNAVSLICGATTLSLKPGRLYLVSTDGTADGLKAFDVGGVSEPRDVSVFVPGTMQDGQLLYSTKSQRAWSLPINLTGSFATGTDAATAATTVTLKKNGSSIGSVVWGTGDTDATFTFASAVSFAVGDVFTIEITTADATLANVSFDLLGSR